LAKRFDEAGEVLFGNETRRRCRQDGQLQTGLPEALDMGTALIWCSEYIQLLDHLFGKSRLCHRAISGFPVAMYFVKDVSVAKMPEPLDIRIGLTIPYKHPAELFEGLLAIVRDRRVNVTTNVDL
jgi:hypothetical protein